MAQRQSSQGIDGIIKEQGVAPPRPKEKRIEVLFEAVKKLVLVVLLTAVYMYRIMVFMVELFHILGAIDVVVLT